MSVDRSGLVALALLAAMAGCSSGSSGFTTPGPAAPRPGLPPAPPLGSLVLARQHGRLAVALAVAPRTLQASILAQTGSGAGGLDVAFRVGGRSIAAEPCGAGCYRASARVGAARSVDVVIDGREASFALPRRMPAPRADALLARARAVFPRLRSAVIDERLSSGLGVAVVTRFEFLAPDRMHYRIAGGAQAVVIGGKRWDRDPGGPWRASPQTPLRVPSAPWLADVVDAHVLSTGVARGRPVVVVSFLDPSVPAWFEATIDRATYRTVDVRMTAAAHFMHDRYSRFDRPLTIRPPVPRR